MVVALPRRDRSIEDFYKPDLHLFTFIGLSWFILRHGWTCSVDPQSDVLELSRQIPLVLTLRFQATFDWHGPPLRPTTRVSSLEMSALPV